MQSFVPRDTFTFKIQRELCHRFGPEKFRAPRLLIIFQGIRRKWLRIDRRLSRTSETCGPCLLLTCYLDGSNSNKGSQTRQ